MSYQLNDRVTILRGGIEGFPQVNLNGIHGRVCSTHANALPGMISVWVNWKGTPYEKIADLPSVINNFPADLEPFNENPQPKLKSVRPVFSLSTPDASDNKDASSEQNSSAEQNPDEDEKPTLRMI